MFSLLVSCCGCPSVAWSPISGALGIKTKNSNNTIIKSSKIQSIETCPLYAAAAVAWSFLIENNKTQSNWRLRCVPVRLSSLVTVNSTLCCCLLAPCLPRVKHGRSRRRRRPPPRLTSFTVTSVRVISLRLLPDLRRHCRRSYSSLLTVTGVSIFLRVSVRLWHDPRSVVRLWNKENNSNLELSDSFACRLQ